MGPRALAASIIAAAIPSIAVAQTAGSLTANPTQVGRADCAGSTNVILSWTINTANTGGSAVVNNDKYRVAVYASADSCPDPASAPAVTASNVVVADVLAAGDTDTETVTSGAIAQAGGVTCPAAGVSAADVSKKLCVYLVDSGGAVRGSTGAAAEGTFTFKLARPPPPVLDSIDPANGALIANFHAGTATGLDTATSESFRVDAYLGGSVVASASGPSSPIRVKGLTNGTTYTLDVVAFSPSPISNQSDPSNQLSETPLPFDSFWTAYQNAGGREQGGCGGGAGALSLLALLPLALRRRRP